MFRGLGSTVADLAAKELFITGSEERGSACECLVVGQTKTIRRDRSKTLARHAPCRGEWLWLPFLYSTDPADYWFSRSTSARSNRTSPP
jgi:hypothetical protein